MNDEHQKTLKAQIDANLRAEEKAGEDARHPDRHEPSDSKVPTTDGDTDASGDAYNGSGEDNHQSGE